jgi:outer membrane protein
VGRAEAEHPLVQQASAGLTVAELETRKAQAARLPTLDATAQYQVGRGPTTGVPYSYVRSHNATVGLQFNLPLYTGGAVQNRIAETLALENKARTDLDAARRGTAQATRTAYFGVVSGQGQVKALEAAEASSQSALEANQLGYQVGVRINIDVLNAQSQLFQTKASLAKARYDVLVGGLRLRQASGVLQTEDLGPVNALLAP